MKKIFIYATLFYFGVQSCVAQIKVACIGNSITAGEYPNILQNLLGASYQVQGWGQSGSKMCFSSNSSWVKLNWPGPAGIKWQQPNIITIKLGTNDSQSGTWPNCKSSFKEDYKKFIDSLYKWVSIKPQIYLCLPSPSTDNNGFSIKGSTIINEIIPIIKEIGEELKLPIIDLNTPLLGKQSEYFPDGVHPNTEGSRAIAELIQKAILQPLSIDINSKTKHYYISPNPTNTNHFTLNSNIYPNNSPLEIIDALGNTLLQLSNVRNNEPIDLSHLKDGIYFVKFDNQILKLNVIR